MDEHLEANRNAWDAWAPRHAASVFYDVDGFKRGRCTLLQADRDEVGDVASKTLLHLQCHFGLDTLSWARLGAVVTGVDFSGEAIALARSLATETAIPATFVESDVYGLPQRLGGPFDIVFTSAGVLCWLPDLQRWADVIAHFLRPGGVFYIREHHPFANVFEYADAATAATIRYPYFHSDEPERYEGSGSYAAADNGVSTVKYEWAHALSDVVNALIGAGLRLAFVHEFPFCDYQARPFLTQADDGLWRYPAAPDSLPLMFSIKAVKDPQP